MAATGKVGGKPDPHSFKSKTRADNPFAKAKHIGVIMFPAHPGGKQFMAQGSPDLAVPVGGHRHADPRTADQNTPIAWTFLHLLTHGPGKIGIINGFLGISAAILNRMAQFFQEVYDFTLQPKSAVITTNSNLHIYPSYLTDHRVRGYQKNAPPHDL